MKASGHGLEGSARGRWTCAIAAAVALTVLSVASGPARAMPIHIGGTDTISTYTGAGLAAPDAGVLTFDDASGPGLVTTDDQAIGLQTTGENQDTVSFEAILSPLQQNGNPFDPATTNIKRAVFEGTGGHEFKIIDGTDGFTVLLALNLSFIDVASSTTWADPVLGDPDGLIIMGDSTEAAFGFSSALQVSGGTLNQLVGGKGTPAVLEITMGTLTPAILAKADLKGYFNDNFLSGVGSPPIATTTWNLTITPIPEPGSAALLGVALIGLLAAARRSRPS